MLKELFTPSGRQELKDFVRDDVLCLFDFDGTLVPLEASPEKVHVPDVVLERLHLLQGRARVGIVTGRGISDMRRMLVFEPDFLLGNHGIEGLPGWEAHATTFEEICEHWHAQLSTQLAAIDKQLWIEYKRYSLSVHYMHVANPLEVASLLPEIFAGLSPTPRVITGKSVFNLLPPNANDKGKAVSELMSFTGASCALYAGDDVTDEHVFELNRPDLFTIRVGASMGSAASYQIADHESIIPLMDLLIEYLPHQRKQG